MDAKQEAFINDVVTGAHAAASALGIPTSVVLAQWADETGWGTSEAFTRGNNFAGVSYLDRFQESLGAHLEDQGEILFYPSRADGLAGYLGRWSDPVYTSTRNAWRDHEHDAIAVAADIEASPWAAGHYGGNGLRSIIVQNDLTRFDGEAPPAPAPGPELPPCGALPSGPPPEGHRLLRIGMHGADVANLQAELAAEGFVALHSFKNGVPDGIFGGGTNQAVADFQSARGLHRDGIVGRQTWCALGVR
jgi:Putative peptidoglycan binding domain/Mannosyl-glycoprotein endo-beta-N-acetylglucosaminidase